MILNKTVIVTGATSGLGLAISDALIKDGYRVIGIGRQEKSDFLKLKDQYPNNLFFIKFNLSNIEEIRHIAKDLITNFGPIYGLVNNAALGYDGILATMHDSQISEMIRVNLEAPIYLTKYLSRSMLMQRQGRIINISSIIAQSGFNGLSVYGATKSSLIGFSKSLAREVGKVGITVNSVAPGFMHTAMTSGLNKTQLESIVRRSPMQALASVHDVASTIKFLMSDEAKMITGTTITVDAGSTC